MPHRILSDPAVVLSDEALTLIKSVDVRDIQALGFQMVNTGNALDQFVIGAKFHPNGIAEAIFSTPTDYTAEAGILIMASGDLTTLSGAPGSGWGILYTQGLYLVQFFAARAAGANTTLNFQAGAYGR